ncbi:MAG: aspartate/tyrosine/aromatic aminotransferase [bacterium]|nr:aspartate/tyrosine/aromatic aminotransferase [bacterium]
MLENISAAPPDPILGLTEAFQQDSRSGKINLTTGVYKDEQGNTPILECVKRAEEKLLKDEKSKGYLGIDGLAEFLNSVRELALPGLAAEDQVAVFQSPGGTGALRVAADFVAKNFAGSRVWLSTPTWPNHPAIFQAAGLETKQYPYLSADRKSLDAAACLETLEKEGRAGDVICLHACCHNPSGVDPNSEQWQQIAELTARIGMLPLIDFAYHGFGDGLQQDRAGIERMAKHHQEYLICSSYSKNFGLYSERIGALMAVCPDAVSTVKVRSNIKTCVRSNYSNPPRHGGAIVACVLGDTELRSLWTSELAAMRDRIHQMRSAFVEAMRHRSPDVDFSFLMDQRGMFSFSGLTPMQVDWLKSEKGIYIVGSGRINVAGITPSNLDYLCDSIAEALSS